jgi:hypothetical protein
MANSVRRRLDPLTMRVWRIVLAVVLVLPFLIVLLAAGGPRLIVYPGATFFYFTAYTPLVAAFVIGLWLLFEAVVVRGGERRFLWSFVVLGVYWLLNVAKLVWMVPVYDSSVRTPSLGNLFQPRWELGGTWLGILLMVAVVVIVAAVERVLQRRDGRSGDVS